jgi:hypothetical protein
MIYRLGELFCGPGGIGWGATNSNIGDDNFRIVMIMMNLPVRHIAIIFVLMLLKLFTMEI